MSRSTNWAVLVGLTAFASLVDLSCGDSSEGGQSGAGGQATGGTAGSGATTSGGGTSGTGAGASGGAGGVGGVSDGGTSGVSGTGGTTSTGGASGAGGTGAGGTGAGGTGGAAAGFRFISWADTKSGTTALSNLSDQAVLLNPVFTVYPGDLVSSWSDSLMDTWVTAVNGQLTGDKTSNKMFEKTFPVRGNHEGSGSGFATYMAAKHPMDATATAVGATNFVNMPGKTNEVYSFDYGNSHIVGLDSLGSAYELTPEQITWADQDLGAAESRGLTHAFLYFHGPIYCVDGHCCTTSGTAGICDSGGVIKSLIDVINKHPIVTASFHGHEHVLAIVHLTAQRDPLFKNEIYQFHTGDAGAGPSTCSSARVDWCLEEHGFATVDVSGKKVTVNYYKEGSATSQKEQVITKP